MDGQVMIDEVVKPILVQFENGYLSQKGREITKFKLLRSTNEKSNKKLMVADSGTLIYSGPVLQKPQSLVKYYLGIIDKKTNRIEQIEKCQLCTLRPKLQENTKVEASKTPKSYRQQTDSLVEAFGSAKQKRSVSARKKNENAQAAISDKVADIAKTISSIKSDVIKVEKETEDISIIPPKNINAKTVQDIFYIDEIISYQTYQTLQDEAKPFIDCNNMKIEEWRDEKKYPEFILHHLSQLPSSLKEREEKACYLCYLNYLMTLFKVDAKEMRKRDPCPSIPEPIKSYMLNSFCHQIPRRPRSCPKKFRDKQLCYILVLSLIIEQFNMNCNLLMKDLKLSNNRISQLLRTIGCVVRVLNMRKRKADDESGLVPDAEPSIHATLTLPKIDVKPRTPSKKIKKEEKNPIKTELSVSEELNQKIENEPNIDQSQQINIKEEPI